MFDKTDGHDNVRNLHLAGLAGRPAKAREAEPEPVETESCPAFGYVRGTHERALAVEFRLRNGNSEWFSYSLLASWRHNPSVGLLLKFTGDVVTLVLIRGSNLGAPVNHSAANLTDRGIQRHRIVWVREMDNDELCKAGKEEPTIDKIEIAEFESPAEVEEWLKKTAPAFVRPVK